LDVHLPSFSYFVVRQERHGRLSHFQGFDWSWIESLGMVVEILRLPANIMDVIRPREFLVRIRAQGYGRHSLEIASLECWNMLRLFTSQF
jgi:hypothetical protein